METLTAIHVLISLVAIVSGFVVVFGLLKPKPLNSWTAIFLFMTAATSVTGFFFPFHGFTPAIGVGVISIVVLAMGFVARYVCKLVGAWRSIYTVTALLALYLNVFVLVVQSFQKIPALKALAPTQSEPPFAGAQLAVLLLFVFLSIAALKRLKRFRQRIRVSARR